MMLTSSLIFSILGLAVATPVELEKRMKIGQTPVLGWLNLPAEIGCIDNSIYDTAQVHAAATSIPSDCSDNKDGFTYCKYTLTPVKPMYSSYMIGRKRPGQQKVHFMTAQTDQLVWDSDGEGQHLERSEQCEWVKQY